MLGGSWSRKLLSFWFKEGKSYKVPFGPIRGTRLYFTRGITFHSMIGDWEQGSQELLSKLITKFDLNKPNKVIADVGANMGFYSIFFSKNLDPTSRIFAFEPSITILPVLRKNMDINHLKNVQIFDMACSDHTGTDEFFISENHHTSSLLEEWSTNATAGTKTVVSTITLDDFFEKYNESRFPDLIKMDIEGGGIYALKGCINCIVKKRPFILFESHNPGEDDAVGNLLRTFNYEAYRISNAKWILHKDKDYTDPDGVWGTMLLMPTERKAAFIK
jgi:FkbM family methyltransferase